MIKVLIVDDSKVQQEFLAHLLSSDPDIEVVGIAGSGSEGIEMVKSKKPDVITMDIHMPEMDGFEATRMIMETIPTPIVIVSGSILSNDVANNFRFLEAGALALVLRPPGFGDPLFTEARKELIQTVKLMSEVRVVRRVTRSRKEDFRLRKVVPSFEDGFDQIKVAAIGASTGGPQVLQKILSSLPDNLPIPVLIVQHIAKGFVKGFRDWLAVSSKIKLKIAEDREPILPGVGYIAPDDHHMGIDKEKKIVLSCSPPENGLRPSVNYLFRSVAQTFGSKSIGILLTGMGKDGASELKNLKEKGAFTMVQNEESSIVFGMPGEALLTGAADNALPPEKISEILSDCGRKGAGQNNNK